MLAIAGSIGSLVLVGALLLSQIILLLNVSLSRALDQTAHVIKQTGQRMNEAVHSGVAAVRERQTAERAANRSFDLKLPEEKTDDDSEPQMALTEAAAAGKENPPASAQHRTGLLGGLRKLWPGAAPDAPDDLAVPDFLQAASAGESTGKNQNAELAVPATKSPYDLLIQDTQVSSTSSQPEVQLPAGVHRVGQNLSCPDVHSGQATDEQPQLPDGRAHWTDRADTAAGGAVSVMQGRKAKLTGPPGSQLSLEIPYQTPPLDLLREEQTSTAVRSANSSSIQALGRKLEHTLESFGIQASVVQVTTGPTITRFELSPGPGVKVSRIVSLADDIALNLAAMGVRIEAPIPGKSAIGIEIPNKETSPVLLRGLLESPEYQRITAPLTAVLGRDIQGSPIFCDLAKMPHLLIAGATGSGKSVCINAILMSILYRESPDDVRMLMIDPKVVELSVYNGIPHLLAPVVTDPKKAANTLLWAVNEMVRRYGLFAEKSVRDINSYNVSFRRGEEGFEKLPLILLVIDELSDLMATTPTEVEDAIARLTAMARAAGIHLIIATQRPSVDVITGVIKANIPSRIAFAVASQVDSRTILDMAGAEKLLGKGDMLYYPQSSAKPIRGQGAFVTDSEVERVLTYIKTQRAVEYDQEITDAIMTATAGNSKEHDSSEQDELLPQALGIVVEAGYASVSLLQRRMNVGYPRAARLIDRMQEMGYVGPFEGSKPRKVLISQAQYLEFKAREGN
ncbi:MAG TPA: cell division protein FtsK [Clostridiales bacterium]|nr:cell division protein FtsK [Clostridiales bacterium]